MFCDSKGLCVAGSASGSSTSIWLAQDWASILSAQSTKDLERIDSSEALRPDVIELFHETDRPLVLSLGIILEGLWLLL